MEKIRLLFDKEQDYSVYADSNAKSEYEKIVSICRNYILQNNIKPTHKILEGESKIFWEVPNTHIALVELKPTMYSFTYNRYGTVMGTDELRQKFWAIFGGSINHSLSLFAEGKHHFKNQLIENLAEEYFLKNSNNLYISNFLGSIEIDGKNYSMVYFYDSISPLEVVWKNYMLGTMKHALFEVEKYNTKSGKKIMYEGKFPTDIIRFDWRNPLPHKDECICDDFAAFYTDVDNAKLTTRLVTYLLKELLSYADYELIDLCYFINYEGNCVCSEITPDGMRIRKHDTSFDKDLWRQGKTEEAIKENWGKLIEDLEKLDSLI